jgi:hypothetical protein
MADGHAIGMVKLHARTGQFIEMRRLVGLASVTLEDFLPNIISKDEKDVRTIGCLNREGDKRQ